MISAFNSTLGSELARSWAARLTGTPLAFWGLGAAAYAWRFGLEDAQARFLALPAPLQAALLLAAPLLIVASDGLARRLDRHILRWLEGYWPEMPPFTWLARWGRRRHQQRYQRLEAEWQQLQHAFQQGRLHDPGARLRLSRLEALLHAYPDDPTHMTLPTQLGLRLRAAETRPLLRYGLDGVICWPALWMVLPEQARQDVAAAWADLSGTARLVFWALLGMVWGAWAWWALPVALGLAWAGYRLVLEATDVFATQVEITFAVHRFALYDALGLQRPTTAEEERQLGAALTAHLWQGTSFPLYAPSDKKQA